MSAAKWTRRTLLASCAAAALSSAEAQAETPPSTPAGIISQALALELAVAFIYTRVLASGLLSPGPRTLAEQIAGQEQVHIRVLGTELARLQAAQPAAPSTAKEAEQLLAPRHPSVTLAGLHTELDALNLLYDAESIAIGIYYDALSKLTDPQLLRTATEIMGAEAQHAVSLAGLIHPGKYDRVVPVASVEGKH